MRKENIDPKSYVIIYEYFNQYAPGITGKTEVGIIFLDEDGYGWRTKKTATQAAKDYGKVNKRIKGVPSPYGEVGLEVTTVEVVRGKDINKRHYYYDLRKIS